ncbi:hypothetical protein D9M69_683840 [compost metagenome]
MPALSAGAVKVLRAASCVASAMLTEAQPVARLAASIVAARKERRVDIDFIGGSLGLKNGCQMGSSELF